VAKAKTREGKNRLEKLSFRMWAWLMRHPKLFEMAGTMGAGVLSSGAKQGWIERAPGLMGFGPLQSWLSQRSMPAPAGKSFRQLWRERRKSNGA
jgi:L-lactate dehydrogenase complex protein LldF